MPWKPFLVDGEYCVFVIDEDDNRTGSSLGCHETKSEADDQVAALNIAESRGLRSLYSTLYSALQAIIKKERKIKDVDEWDGSASRWSSTEDYCNDCLINLNEGDPEDWTQSKCKLPVREPGDSDDTFVRQAVFAAATRINQVDAPEKNLKTAARKLRQAYNEMEQEAPEVIEEIISRTIQRQEELLQETLDKIRGEFNKQFNPGNSWENWLVDASDSFAIGNFSGNLFRITYSMVDGNVIFADRDEWEEVTISYEKRALPMSSVWEQTWEIANQRYPLAFLHDIFTEEQGLFAILSQEGQLYKSPITIAGERVELGEWFLVSQEFPAIQTRTTVLRQADGKHRWFSVSATSTLNRVGEIDSRELFDSFISHIFKTDEYPTRQFYHLGDQFRTGQCDFVARDGFCLITSGLYDDTEFAKLEVVSLDKEPDFWGESIRYIPTSQPDLLDLGVTVPVYRSGILVEITSLPEKDAANLFTVTNQKEVQRMALPTKIWEALIKRFGGDENAATEWLEENVSETNRSIKEQNLITRSQDDSEEQIVEVNLDEELDKVIDSKVEEAVTRAFETLEKPEELTTLLTELKEGQATIVSRLEALEEPEENKKRQLIDDMPRKSPKKIIYRPRGAYQVNEEKVEVAPANEIAKQNRPKNSY